MARSKATKKLGGPKIGGDGPRQAKADAVAEISEKVRASSAVLLSEYRGLTVSELAELRAGLRQAEAEYKVYKNTLAKIATKDLDLTGLDEHLEGPVAFTFASGDPVLAAKALSDFAKKVQALVLKAGILDGKVLTAEQVGALGALDSREVMLAKTAGLFVAPLQRTASLLAAGFQQLGGLLVQLRDKLPAEAAPAGADASGPAVAEAPPAAEDGSDQAEETQPEPEQPAPADGDTQE